MKNSKKLKLILIILICVLIILAGIVGIYTQKSNMYKNLLPDYTLASDIKGSTVLELEVDNSKETVYLDKDSNKVDSSEITEENKDNYTTKEIPVNEEENLTVENYKKSVEIMKERLEFLDADQYQLDLDEKTGKVILTIADDYIEDVESILPMEGKLQIINSDTEEVVIDPTDFKSAQSTYASLEEEVITYISLKLNDSGIEKINNIYKVENSEENDEEDEETDVEDIKLKVMFDGDEVAEITYEEFTLIGKTLRITTASGLTSDSEIQSQLNMDAVVSKLATIGKMPVVYNLTIEEFIKNDTADYIGYIVVTIIAICVIISVYFILKYKVNGLLTTLGFVTNIALFLIIIRLTKIEISLNSFAGILGLIFVYSILTNNLLKAMKGKENSFWENIKSALFSSLDVLVVSLLILVVFSFANMSLINTTGLLLFWGWLITLLGNLIFTIPMLSIVNKK